MNKRFTFVVSCCLFLAFASCQKFKGSQTVPAYIHIESMGVECDYYTYGANTSNITDAWAEYEPGGYFVDLRDEINFTEVPNRTVQQVAAKLVKEGTITQEQWQSILDGSATIEIDEEGNVTPVQPENP